MKVSELLNSRTKKDIEEIAKYLAKTYPDYYSDINKGKSHFKWFLEECNKAKFNNNPELYDFLINIIDYPGDDEITYLDKEETQIDFEKLPRYFNVDAIHLTDLMAKKDTLGYTMQERKEKNVLPVTAWGIDFMDRGDIMNLEIIQLCLDKYDINILAAELFWEMTFYGIENDDIEEKKEELTNAKEIIEQAKEEPEEFEKHCTKASDILDLEEFKPSEKEIAEMYAISDYCGQHIDTFYKEYIEKYGDTQIKRILEQNQKQEER